MIKKDPEVSIAIALGIRLQLEWNTDPHFQILMQIVLHWPIKA